MSTSYITLKPGDVRQKGDEVRHRNLARMVSDKVKPGDWNPVSMVGVVILPADVIVAEFRRAGK